MVDDIFEVASSVDNGESRESPSANVASGSDATKTYLTIKSPDDQVTSLSINQTGSTIQEPTTASKSLLKAESSTILDASLSQSTSTNTSSRATPTTSTVPSKKPPAPKRLSDAPDIFDMFDALYDPKTETYDRLKLREIVRFKPLRTKHNAGNSNSTPGCQTPIENASEKSLGSQTDKKESPDVKLESEITKDEGEDDSDEEIPEETLMASYKQDIALLHHTFRHCRRIVVITGAGISVAAGIPDFRSATGLFRLIRNDLKLRGNGASSGQQMFDASVVFSDDEALSNFHTTMCDLYDLCAKCKPTPFHDLLNDLSKESRLLRLYTQNIDCLDTNLPYLNTKNPLTRPWPKTVQLHGTISEMICSKCSWTDTFNPSLFKTTDVSPRDHRDNNEDDTAVESDPKRTSRADASPDNASMDSGDVGTFDQIKAQFDDSSLEKASGSDDDDDDESDRETIIEQYYIPDCPECIEMEGVRQVAGKRSQGVGKLRPKIVLYNEPNPDSEAIGQVTEHDLLGKPDGLIVVGTTLKIPGVRRMVREMSQAVHAARGVSIWMNIDDPVALSAREFESCFDLIIKCDCQKVSQILRDYEEEKQLFEEFKVEEKERRKQEMEQRKLLREEKLKKKQEREEEKKLKMENELGTTTQVDKKKKKKPTKKSNTGTPKPTSDSKAKSTSTEEPKISATSKSKSPSGRSGVSTPQSTNSSKVNKKTKPKASKSKTSTDTDTKINITQGSIKVEIPIKVENAEELVSKKHVDDALIKPQALDQNQKPEPELKDSTKLANVDYPSSVCPPKPKPKSKSKSNSVKSSKNGKMPASESSEATTLKPNTKCSKVVKTVRKSISKAAPKQKVKEIKAANNEQQELEEKQGKKEKETRVLRGKLARMERAQERLKKLAEQRDDLFIGINGIKQMDSKDDVQFDDTTLPEQAAQESKSESSSPPPPATKAIIISAIEKIQTADRLSPSPSLEPQRNISPVETLSAVSTAPRLQSERSVMPISSILAPLPTQPSMFSDPVRPLLSELATKLSPQSPQQLATPISQESQPFPRTPPSSLETLASLATRLASPESSRSNDPNMLKRKLDSYNPYPNDTHSRIPPHSQAFYSPPQSSHRSDSQYYYYPHPQQQHYQHPHFTNQPFYPPPR